MSPTSPSDAASPEPETRERSADAAKKEKAPPVEKEKRPSVEKEKRPSLEFGPPEKKLKAAAAAKKAPAPAPRKRVDSDGAVKAQGVDRRVMIYAAAAVLGAKGRVARFFRRICRFFYPFARFVFFRVIFSACCICRFTRDSAADSRRQAPGPVQ